MKSTCKIHDFLRTKLTLAATSSVARPEAMMKVKAEGEERKKLFRETSQKKG